MPPRTTAYMLRWFAKRHHIRVPSLLADTLVRQPPPPEKDLVGAMAEGATAAETLAEVHE